MSVVLKYIEKKSGHSDNGPAWIAYCKESKTGQTLYFKGMAFKRLGGHGVAGNYREVSTGDEYWISGPKKDGKDRHWAGSGKILIQSTAVSEYLELRGIAKLESNFFEIVDINEEPYNESLHDLENQKIAD